MEIHWISIVLVSATIHPLRELLLNKASNPVACYLGVAVVWLVLATFQNIIVGNDFRIPGDCWPLIVISASGLTLYYYGTLAAMKVGQMSIYYPIVRSSPIAIVIFSWLILGEKYTSLSVIAILVIFVGAIMLQNSEPGFLGKKKALALAFMAMAGSASYSISDAIAVQKVNPSTLLFYCYILVSLFLFLMLSFNNKIKKNTVIVLIEQWKLDQYRILSAGVISYCSYYLILIVFELGGDAAIVSAIRQASIPISVLLAGYYLKENETFRRLGWATLIAVGIFLLSITD